MNINKHVMVQILIWYFCFIPMNANAEVLVFGSDGNFFSKSTITDAATSADAAGKTIVVTTPQTLTSVVNIPGDRKFTVEKNGIITYSGAGKLTFSAGAVDRVYPQWWGAKADGTNDDQSAIQAALDTGQSIYLPRGTYLISSSLHVPISGTHVVGEGYNSVIKSNNLTSDVFVIGNGIDPIKGLVFKNFHVWSVVDKTNGYVFNCRQITNSRFENITSGSINDYVENSNKHRLYNGYYFDRFSQVIIDGGEIVVANDAVKARGNFNQSFGAELSIDGGLRIYGARSKAIWLGGACGGVYLGRVDISDCGYGIYCDDTLQPGAYNRELFLGPSSTIDSCKGWGINIENNGLAVLEATGTWIANNGSGSNETGGIRIAPSSGANLSAKWVGMRLQYSSYDGMQLFSGTHVFTGGFINSNGAGKSGGHGIYIANSQGERTVINGVMIHNNGNSNRGSGISISPESDNFLIQGNQLFGNMQGQIQNSSGTSITKIIKNNVGYVTENNGTAIIAKGQSTVSVIHGLSEKPTNILISSTSSSDSGASAYIDQKSITATKFDITYFKPVDSTKTYYWYATKGNQ